jgi:acetylglutamate kinase
MKPIVVKVGGSTLGQHDTAIEDIAALHREGRPVIVVHGGGSAATEWLKIHGVASEFIDGLRVTGPEAIEVVTAVFAGLVNKQLVGQLLARGVRAAGISGVDGALISTRRLDGRLGFVGEVTHVTPALLESLLRDGFLPVLSPVSVLEENLCQLMNVNADTIAGEVAAATAAEALVFLTDVPGVRGSDGGLLNELSIAETEALLRDGVAAGGMSPKLRACITAVRAGVRAFIIDGREPHALSMVLSGAAGGTFVTA